LVFSPAARAALSFRQGFSRKLSVMRVHGHRSDRRGLGACGLCRDRRRRRPAGCPPVSGRAATALSVVLIATIGTVALSEQLGPGAVADALAGTQPGTLPAALPAAIAGALAWAAAAGWLARHLEGRAG